MIASNSIGVNRPRRGLPSATVVGAFDPGDDGDAQLLAGVPAAAVQDVLLQQAEEGLHGRVVTGSPDAAHRSDHVVSAQGVDELSATKLTRFNRWTQHLDDGGVFDGTTTRMGSGVDGAGGDALTGTAAGT